MNQPVTPENTTPAPIHARIVCILDKSGSMINLRGTAIEQFNAFIRKQKGVSGTADVTLCLFNESLRTVYENRSIQEVPELNDEDYLTEGGTALLDAVGTMVDRIRNQFTEAEKNGEDIPDQVHFLIVTDGQENSSTEYVYTIDNGKKVRDNDRVKKMVDFVQNREGWIFTFIGCEQPLEEAAKVGVPMAGSYSFTPNAKGMRDAFTIASHAATHTRTRGTRYVSKTNDASAEVDYLMTSGELMGAEGEEEMG